MHNISLAQDYVKRAVIRLKAIQVLLDEKSWPDVIRESQECIELAIKGFLRHAGVSFPRSHDVSPILLSEKDRLPQSIHKDLKKIAEISKSLRRDRELAFYGSEDLTPSEFYTEEDGVEAFANAKFVVQQIDAAMNKRIPDAR